MTYHVIYYCTQYLQFKMLRTMSSLCVPNFDSAQIQRRFVEDVKTQNLCSCGCEEFNSWKISLRWFNNWSKLKKKAMDIYHDRTQIHFLVTFHCCRRSGFISSIFWLFSHRKLFPWRAWLSAPAKIYLVLGRNVEIKLEVVNDGTSKFQSLRDSNCTLILQH